MEAAQNTSNGELDDNLTTEEDLEGIEEEEEYHDEYGLSYFQASLFASIFEDTIAELRILGECNNELRNLKLATDMGLLVALKFDVKQPVVEDELDNYDEKHLDCDKYKLYKLDADRKYIYNVCIDTYIDLSLSKSFRALAQYVKDVIVLEEHRFNVQEEEAKNRVIRKELTKQLRQQRNHVKSVTYDTDAVIEDLKSQVEDSTLNEAIRSRYVESWQMARTEQHLQTIHDAEYEPNTTIHYFKQRTDHEHRVHTEVELLTNIVINETLEKVEEWMAKYDKDMEKLDLKIQITKNKYQDMFNKRIDLEQTIEKHDQMMKAWIHFKDEREKALQYRNTMTKSAIIVQAWWRGILVRRQLGPYKPKKKPPKKKE